MRARMHLRGSLKLAVIAFTVTASHPSTAQQPWEKFPRPTSRWIESASGKGCVQVGKARMFYAVFGTGDPILLIHGGLGNANVWEDQVKALSRNHMVIVADSRGHGRSTRAGNDMHYRTMTDDYVALLDHLKLPKVTVVGWSDGANIGLDMAMRYPSRVTRLFAHAANSKPGVAPAGAAGRAAWNAYAAWAKQDYDELSGARCGDARAPKTGYQGLATALRAMWISQPSWSDADLKRIKIPTAIVLGDHDEIVSCRHARYLASTIPGAQLVVLPNVGHFAMRQDSSNYNTAIAHLIDGGPAPKTGTCIP
jgi:pimeloyl-ACP methyl ester carboxylesterase